MIFGRNKRNADNRNLTGLVNSMFDPSGYSCFNKRDALLLLAAYFDLISMETIALLMDKDVSDINDYNPHFASCVKDGYLMRHALYPKHNNISYVYSITTKGISFISSLMNTAAMQDLKAPSYNGNGSHIRHDYLTGLSIAGLLSHNLKPAAVKMESKIIPEEESGMNSNRGISFSDGSLTISGCCNILFEFDTGNEPVTPGSMGKYRRYRNDLISKFGRYEASDFFKGAGLTENPNTRVLFCFERSVATDDKVSHSELFRILDIWSRFNETLPATYSQFVSRIGKVYETLMRNNSFSLSDYESYEGKDRVMRDIRSVIPIVKETFLIKEYSRLHQAKKNNSKTADITRTFEECWSEYLIKRISLLRKELSDLSKEASHATRDDLSSPESFSVFIRGRSHIRQVRFCRNRKYSIMDSLCRNMLSDGTDEMAANSLTLIIKGVSYYALPAPLVGAYSEYIVPNDRYTTSIARTIQAYSNASYFSLVYKEPFDSVNLMNAPAAFKGMVTGGCILKKDPKSQGKKDSLQKSVYFENISLDISGFIRAIASASYMTDSDREVHVLYVEDILDARFFIEILKKYSVDGYDRVIPPERVLGGYDYVYPDKIDLDNPGPFHYVFCRMPAAMPVSCISSETLKIPEDHMFTFNRKGELKIFNPDGKGDIATKGTIYTGDFDSESHSPTSAVLDPVGFLSDEENDNLF